MAAQWRTQRTVRTRRTMKVSADSEGVLQTSTLIISNHSEHPHNDLCFNRWSRIQRNLKDSTCFQASKAERKQGVCHQIENVWKATRYRMISKGQKRPPGPLGGHFKHILHEIYFFKWSTTIIELQCGPNHSMTLTLTLHSIQICTTWVSETELKVRSFAVFEWCERASTIYFAAARRTKLTHARSKHPQAAHFAKEKLSNNSNNKCLQPAYPWCVAPTGRNQNPRNPQLMYKQGILLMMWMADVSGTQMWSEHRIPGKHTTPKLKNYDFYMIFIWNSIWNRM